MFFCIIIKAKVHNGANGVEIMILTEQIECGRWKAVIAPELGGNVVRLQENGRDVLVPLDSMEAFRENPYIQGSPVLLPANRTANGRFIFEGKTYELPVNEPATNAHLHGLLYDRSFQVTDRKGDEITLMFRNQGEVYPFFFSLEIHYRITELGLRQEYTLKNTGDSKMPFTFALHTSFIEPDHFSVPLECRQEKDERHIPTGRYVPLNEQERGYVAGSPSRGMVVSGYYRSSGNTALVGDYCYTVSEGFDYWVLFNGKGEKGLLCVEPQCGAVNGLNLPGGHRILAPGEMQFFWTEISNQNHR